MKKFMKKAVALVLVCGVMFGSVAKVEAASQLGSASKAYPKKMGYVTVLSDIAGDGRYFMKGSISYNTKSMLNIEAHGFYKDFYGRISKVEAYYTESGRKTTALATNRGYAGSNVTPICNSNYPNVATGYSSVGGSLKVTRK